MKYDFETAVDRFGKDSISANIVPWNVTPDEGFSRIPMWCAQKEEFEEILRSISK